MTEPMGSIDSAPVIDSLLVKLAMRCNLACTYCYWFRDSTVYDKAPLLTDAAATSLVERFDEHLEQYQLPQFTIMFHGGEPLLYGKRRFASLASDLREVAVRRGCTLVLSVQTNGVLVDEEWATLLMAHHVSVGVSLDGPPEIHDRTRIDLHGHASHARVVRGIRTLQDAGVPVGVLAVCDPSSDPRALLAHVVGELGVGSIDVLMPDATHDDVVAPIGPYLERLFDVWLDEFSEQGVSIRFLEAALQGLLGGRSTSQSIGFGPVTTVTVLTDGSLEALDVCRIAGDGATSSELNLATHRIDEISADPLWREIHDASIRLSATCQACPLRAACGGGHIASRWSNDRRFDNPSVHCDGYRQFFSHAWSRTAPSLAVETSAGAIPLLSCGVGA